MIIKPCTEKYLYIAHDDDDEQDEEEYYIHERDCKESISRKKDIFLYMPLIYFGWYEDDDDAEQKKKRTYTHTRF